MWNEAGRYRLPDGARVVSGEGDRVRMNVDIPGDEHGFLGRQCPECRQVFRMSSQDYKTLPENPSLWCVYCGHRDGHSHFLTEQQLARAKRAAADVGMQMVSQALGQAFKRPIRSRGSSMGSRRSSGVSVRMTYRSKPFFPAPLPGITEENLIRIRQCGGCQVRYAVFGEHRFCPVCGPLPPDVVALDALGAEVARLDAMAELPPAAAATLREQGALTRLWVDTLENLVGVVETLAGAVFRAAVTDAEARLKGKGNIFQRLDPMADLFVDAGYDDLRTAVDAAIWQRLQQTWATRHVFTHNDGIVDDKYLAKAPAGNARLGQRLTLTEAECRRAIADTTTLCDAITALSAPPR
ncbi:hypothetical protein [Cryptosporangium japonicum]|uniref:Uncharacterized protein n=1 Tax=Cryptosporangium japonicum TaxID=80872 RepID=A0ABP3DRF9_9ACTN